MSAGVGLGSIMSLAPFDTRSVFFAGASHHEGLARLDYLVESGQGCGIVTGPTGVGKSTLLHMFAQDCVGAHRGVVSIDLTALGPADLLRHLAEGLGTSSHADGQISKLWTEVSDGLIGHRHTRRGSIVILDHLDQAAADCRPVVRRLLAQHARLSDLTLILAFAGGSYPVVAKEWRQEADLRIELSPLTPDETAAFLQALLGARELSPDAFEPAAAEVVFQLTGGVPRHIVRLFAHSLLAAAHDRQPHISSEVVEAAMHELRCLRPSA
jgi:general secretion pathway protein A